MSQPSQAEPLSIDSLIDRCMGAADFALSIVEQFLASCETDVCKLKQLWAAADCRELAQQAHRMKGAASQVAASDLASRLEDIEQSAKAGDVPRNDSAITEIETEVERIRGLVESELRPRVQNATTC